MFPPALRASRPSCSAPRSVAFTRRSAPRLHTLVLACAAAWGALGALPAHAQSGAPSALSAPRAFATEAQPLGQALNALARQAGVAISVNADLVAGKSAPAVQGTMSLRDALDRVLSGSGLAAQDDGGSVTLRPAPVTAPAAPVAGSMLPAVRVVAGAESPGTFRLRGEPGPVEPGIVTSRMVEQYAASDLEDLFSGQPEVSVGGGHSVAQKLYLRGIEDTLINVTIDGAGQAGQAFHHAGRVQIEPELVKQVEVKPGTGDATAGPGALGGVVRFVTKDPSDLLRPGQKVGVLLKGGYFSNAEGFKAHTSVYAQFTDQWSGLAAFTQQDQNDHEDGDGQRVDSTGAKQKLGFLKLVGQLTDDQTLRLSHERNTNDGARPRRPQWVTSGFNPAFPLQSARSTWTLGYAWQPASTVIDLDASVYRTDSELDQTTTLFGRYLGRIVSSGLDLRNTSQWGDHAVTYGVDHRKDRITAGPVDDPTSASERGRITGLYVQDHMTLTQQLSLSFGARYYRYTLDDANGLRFDDTGVSPNASLRYEVTPGFALLAGHSRALRGPKVRDAFKLDVVTNDSARQAERARTSEAGFEAGSGNWRLNGKAYLTTIRNAISDPIGAPVQYQNVGEVESRGVLLHTTYDWKPLKLGAAFHHNRATLNGQRLNVYEHNGLGASQGNTLTTSLDWRVNAGLDVGWMGRFVQGIGTLQTTVGTVSKPGYAVHDVYANWRPTGRDNLTLSLVVSNLFDKNYLDHGTNEDFQAIPGYTGIVGAREPGREFRVNASWRF
jgi:hemoglobin/transferrin/lactoferrin receptor protein